MQKKFTKLSDFAFQTYRLIQKHELLSAEFLLGVSGGLDSVLLLDVFRELKERKNIRFRVVSLHHGFSSHDLQMEYRNKAWQLVADYCQKYSLDFVSNVSHLKIKKQNSKCHFESEESLRNFRKTQILKLKNKSEIFVSAHHAQDLLETRFMRLMRGTGPSGLLAMQVWNGKVFRPFLEIEKSEINKQFYLRELKKVEDPSNIDQRYMRNALRHHILPMMDELRPGSCGNFAASLMRICHALQEENLLERTMNQNQLKLSAFLSLSREQKLQVLAQYLNHGQIYAFRQGQLLEILKLLEQKQSNLSFKMLGLQWIKNSSSIYYLS